MTGSTRLEPLSGSPRNRRSHKEIGGRIQGQYALAGDISVPCSLSREPVGEDENDAVPFCLISW